MTNLTTSQAAELYTQLTGKSIKRQRIQQFCKSGDIQSKRVIKTIVETQIPRSEIERIVRDGLPKKQV